MSRETKQTEANRPHPGEDAAADPKDQPSKGENLYADANSIPAGYPEQCVHGSGGRSGPSPHNSPIAGLHTVRAGRWGTLVCQYPGDRQEVLQCAESRPLESLLQDQVDAAICVVRHQPLLRSPLPAQIGFRDGHRYPRCRRGYRGQGEEAILKLPIQAKPAIRIPAPVARSIGLGEVIKGVTRTFGIDPCQGCTRRAATLNRWVVFVPYNAQR